jgi:DNA-binding winged helix-turn-helix (wHTH) protein/Tfp pilus assembly protein PilF
VNTPAYEFEGFRLDPQMRVLFTREGAAVDLQPRVFDALLHFVQRPGELLGKRELLTALWPNVIVEENSLNQVVSQLRKALGERPAEHRYVVTAPGRGYRFVAAVRAVTRDAEVSPLPRPRPPAAGVDAASESFFGYLKALALAQNPAPGNVANTIELLREAVADSPEFVRAHSLLAIQYTTAVMFGYAGAATLDLARQEVATALGMDDQNGETWCAAGVIDCLGGNWSRAEERFRFAQSLTGDPLASGLRCAYLTLSVGQLARAMQQAEYTLQVAPTHALGVQMLALLHLTLGRDPQALRFAQLSVELGQSADVAPMADLFALLALRGGDAGPIQELEEEAAALPPAALDPPMRKRLILRHARFGELDAAYRIAFASLDHYARESTVGGAWGMLWLPEMQAFRDDERFQLFARRLRLFEYWSEYGPPDGYSLAGERLLRAG